VEKNTLRIKISEAVDEERLIKEFREEVKILEVGIRGTKDDKESLSSSNDDDGSPLPESTLLVVPSSSLLSTYRDLYLLSWKLQEILVECKLEKELQLVLFHPKGRQSGYQQYVHENQNEMNNNDDHNHDLDLDLPVEDYPTKSPYPTIHLLREKDILKAVKSTGEKIAQEIPSKNRERLDKMGVEKVKKDWRESVHGSGGG